MQKPRDYTEENLVKALKAGSREAFEYLYENYSPTLYGVIYNVVREEELANDVLQDVFVKIWKNIASYSPEKGRIYTWMLNVARNASIDKLRSKSYKKSTKTHSLENSVNVIDSGIETYVDHIGLEKEVGKLTEYQQMLIRKIYFEGYTQAELAEELDIPLGTVKTRIRKAIQILRSKIVEE